MADTGKKLKRTKPRPIKENNAIDQKELISPSKGVRDQTKATFELLMKQALNDSKEEPKSNKKTKKKQRSQTADSVIKNLNADFSKDDNGDTSRLANTFDPDDFPKSTKSNKRRQRLREQGLENPAYQTDLINEDDQSPKNNKKKSPRKPKMIKDEDRTMTISELETSPPAAVKKKKKKKKPMEEEIEEEQSKDKIDDTKDEPAAEEESKPKRKIKKTRKKQEEPVEEVQEDETYVPPDIEDTGSILSVTIHKTDTLKTDFYINHPLVKVHVINMDNGAYLKKQHRDRAVTSFYEAVEDDHIDYIMPIMTQPFDFKKHKSTLPAWEELIIFNENFNYFVQDNPRVIIFFEIIDFVSMNAIRNNNILVQDGGWHRIAWAFLKVLGSNGVSNIEKKVRLQLYHPPSKTRPPPGVVDVYHWWKSLPRVSYPSTLYVTLKGVTPLDEMEPALRSMFATQKERGKLSLTDLKKTLEGGERSDIKDDSKKTPSSWTRLTGQVCKIPNSLSLSLSGGRQGCFVIKFSNDGKYIACACHDKGAYPILIYEIPSGKLKGELVGHYSIVYDINWSKNSKEILTASADGSARVWNSRNFNSNEVKILPHPSFVYTAQYHPRVGTVIASGGYDSIVRVWSTFTEGSHAQLMQEIEGHVGYINSLCFDQEGQKMYSADSIGTLMVWNVYVTERPGRKGVLRDWTKFKEHTDDEYKGTPINLVKMHPGGRRLLIHCRDNTIRMIDLRMFSVMQRYAGALNFREQIRSTVSPCGSFVISGSESAAAYVWNTETGDQVAMYTELNYKQAVSDVDFHPFEHMVAFCSFRDNQPILIYTYDPIVAQQNATLDGVGGRGLTTLKNTAKISTTKKGALQNPSTLSKQEFSLQQTGRMDNIMTKLNAVSAFSGGYKKPSAASQSKVHFTPGGTSSMISTGGWGSTFDTTMMSQQGRAITPTPSAFSPHAGTSLDRTTQQQQLQSQSQYLLDSQSPWRPSFGSIGRKGSGRAKSPTHKPSYGRPPHISLNMTHDKPQFTFQGPAKRQKQVVALYDYAAQRSDELSINRGDVIAVLYKDNENWWMGQLSDGTVGFFPANYVTMKDSVEEDSDDKEIESEEYVKPKKTTAVVNKSGELKFISETDESEVETSSKRHRRRRKATREGLDATEKYRLTRTPSMRSLDDSNA